MKRSRKTVRRVIARKRKAGGPRWYYKKRKPRKNPASSWTSLLLRTFLGATGGFITASIVTGAGAAAIGLPGAEAAAETAKRSWTGAIVGGIAGLLVKKPLTAAAVGALAGGTGVAIFGVASGARSGVAGYHSLAAYVPAGQDTTSALAGYVVG